MNSKQQKIHDYFKRYNELLKDIKDKNATWADMEGLRLEYLDVLPHYGADTLRRGSLLYREFLDNGLINIINNPTEEIGVESFPIVLEHKADGTITNQKVIALQVEDIKNKEKLLKAHGYDPNEFELISAKNSIWQSGKDKDGKTKNLYSSKISVKPKTDIINRDKNFYSEILDKLAQNYNNPNKEFHHDNEIKLHDINKDKCLILSFNDLHWGRYSSDEDYFHSLKHDIDNILREITYRFQNRRKEIKKIVILLGSDFFNSDCYGVTTLHKNKQDNCMNFKDMFSSGLQCCVNIVKDLQITLCENIEVIVIPGNHGENEDYVLGQCLKAFFNNDKRINVQADSNNRKYFNFGNNLIGFTHGDKEKNKLSNLMAVEVPWLWPTCNTRFWITGHIHSQKEIIIEENGVIIYSCPSLAYYDEYTKTRGYKGERKIMGFLLDKKNLIETHYFTPEIPED